MTTVKTILVPVDFAEGSLAALQHARELAAMFNSNVHLLHVAPGFEMPDWANELFGSKARSMEARKRLEGLDKLATLIACHRFDPYTTTGLVRTGCAEQVIADYANEIRADLIVMGVHGDRTVATEAVGHVMERVLGRVECPVLAIPEHQLVARATANQDYEAAIAC
jgi:nucleotide-binding universal stress UspA family protein